MIKSELRKLDRNLCPVGKALDEIGDKWIILILRECFFGFKRFEDFQTNLNISRSVLTTRLRLLVKSDILKRNEYRKLNQRVRYEYSLTDKGLDLIKLFVSLFQWGNRYALLEEKSSYQLVEKRTGSPVVVNISNYLGEKLDLRDIRLQFIK